MLKKLGIPVLALLGVMALASPRPAQAGVHFGVYVGPSAPVYAAPAYPAYPNYYAPPAYAEGYAPAPAYVDPGYVAPAYGYGYGPGVGFGFGFHDHDFRHYDHDRGGFRGGHFEGHRR